MRKLHVFSLLFLFFVDHLSSTELSVYKQELKNFKTSEKYKDIFDTKLPEYVKYIDINIEKYKNTDWKQRVLSFTEFFNPIVITKKSMPKLYNFIEETCKKSNIKTPTVLLTTKKGLFNAMAMKFFTSMGCIIIGQDIILESSSDEVEAVLAHEIGHIKHNHVNKNLAINLAGLIASQIILNKLELKNSLIRYYLVLKLSSISTLFSKYFEKQADQFAFEQGKAKGIKKFFKKLQNQWDQVDIKLANSKEKIRNASNKVGTFNYYKLMLQYYCAKGYRSYSKALKWLNDNTLLGSHPSHKERVQAAREYMQTHGAA